MAPPKKNKGSSLRGSADQAIEATNSLVVAVSDLPEKTKEARMALAIASVNKRMRGRAFVKPADQVEQAHHIRRPFGIPDLDLDIAGGLPGASICQLFGVDGCLDGDTFIPYAVVSPTGAVQNCKGGTLRKLYERFNKLPSSGKGNYRRKVSTESSFVTACVSETGRIFRNEIVGVISTGEKVCYEVVSSSGNRILATEDHRFFTGSEYVPLGELSVGATVFVHNNVPFTAEHKKPPAKRRYLYVKHHPHAGNKKASPRYKNRVYEHTYKRLLRSHAVIESHMNGLSLPEYVSRLDSGELGGLVFLDPKLQVHHIDENPLNDAFENLEVVDIADHSRRHTKDQHDKFRFMIVESKIESISIVGHRPTFDVQMKSPHHNFVANGFVVHNSGKNFLTDCLIRNLQINYGEDASVAFVSFGYGYDKDRGHQNGVAVPMSTAEVERLAKSRNMNEEEIARRKKKIGHFVEICRGDVPEAEEKPAEFLLETVIQLIRTGEFQLIVIDEANAAPTGALMAKTLDENPRQAHNATLLTQFVARFFSAIATPLANGKLNETTVVAILEARAKIGGFSPDPNALEQTGGHALKHAKAIDIELKRGAPIVVDTKKIGKEVPWRILKAKLGSHEGYSGSFPLMFSTEPDSGGAQTGGPLLAIAVELGAIQVSGATYSIDGERIAVGKEKTMAALDTNEDLYAKVYMRCLEAKRINPQYR